MTKDFPFSLEEFRSHIAVVGRFHDGDETAKEFGYEDAVGGFRFGCMRGRSSLTIGAANVVGMKLLTLPQYESGVKDGDLKPAHFKFVNMNSDSLRKMLNNPGGFDLQKFGGDLFVELLDLLDEALPFRHPNFEDLLSEAFARFYDARHRSNSVVLRSLRNCMTNEAVAPRFCSYLRCAPGLEEEYLETLPAVIGRVGGESFDPGTNAGARQLRRIREDLRDFRAALADSGGVGDLDKALEDGRDLVEKFALPTIEGLDPTDRGRSPAGYLRELWREFQRVNGRLEDISQNEPFFAVMMVWYFSRLGLIRAGTAVDRTEDEAAAEVIERLEVQGMLNPPNALGREELRRQAEVASAKYEELKKKFIDGQDQDGARDRAAMELLVANGKSSRWNAYMSAATFALENLLDLLAEDMTVIFLLANPAIGAQRRKTEAFYRESRGLFSAYEKGGRGSELSHTKLRELFGPQNGNVQEGAAQEGQPVGTTFREFVAGRLESFLAGEGEQKEADELSHAFDEAFAVWEVEWDMRAAEQMLKQKSDELGRDVDGAISGYRTTLSSWDRGNRDGKRIGAPGSSWLEWTAPEDADSKSDRDAANTGRDDLKQSGKERPSVGAGALVEPSVGMPQVKADGMGGDVSPGRGETPGAGSEESGRSGEPGSPGGPSELVNEGGANPSPSLLGPLPNIHEDALRPPGADQTEMVQKQGRDFRELMREAFDNDASGLFDSGRPENAQHRARMRALLFGEYLIGCPEDRKSLGREDESLGISLALHMIRYLGASKEFEDAGRGELKEAEARKTPEDPWIRPLGEAAGSALGGKKEARDNLEAFVVEWRNNARGIAELVRDLTEMNDVMSLLERLKWSRRQGRVTIINSTLEDHARGQATELKLVARPVASKGAPPGIVYLTPRAGESPDSVDLTPIARRLFEGGGAMAGPFSSAGDSPKNVADGHQNCVWAFPLFVGRGLRQAAGLDLPHISLPGNFQSPLSHAVQCLSGAVSDRERSSYGENIGLEQSSTFEEAGLGWIDPGSTSWQAWSAVLAGRGGRDYLGPQFASRIVTLALAHLVSCKGRKRLSEDVIFPRALLGALEDIAAVYEGYLGEQDVRESLEIAKDGGDGEPSWQQAPTSSKPAAPADLRLYGDAQRPLRALFQRAYACL